MFRTILLGRALGAAEVVCGLLVFSFFSNWGVSFAGVARGLELIRTSHWSVHLPSCKLYSAATMCCFRFFLELTTYSIWNKLASRSLQGRAQIVVLVCSWFVESKELLKIVKSLDLQKLRLWSFHCNSSYEAHPHSRASSELHPQVCCPVARQPSSSRADPLLSSGLTLVMHPPDLSDHVEWLGVVLGVCLRPLIYVMCTSCANDVPILHPSQLTNPFLGLPVESGKCEACGTTEHGQCEGHFGYVELPIPIYHPCHVLELKHILDLVCLKCLRMKKGKVRRKVDGKASRSSCLYCRDLPPICVNEIKASDDEFGLELKAYFPKGRRTPDGFWNFLERYGGFQYGDSSSRPLLPCEALIVLKQIPLETRRKLVSRGCHPQNGFIMQSLPIPPNCLYSPDYTDGKSIMSSDISLSLLKKVLNKVKDIKSSRSGSPNFVSHDAEANELQAAISRYIRLRGTPKLPHDINRKIGLMEGGVVSTRQWMEKMRTLFIRKSSGFSSRTVITGDTYKGVNDIGLPLYIASKITVEDKVTAHNIKHLQEIVDNHQCLMYRDGQFTYAITVGSKGHTSLKVGQVVHRRIMDGDVVLVNRPPSTHKHSIQAFSVYIHDDHTVKINPLICSPLGADFDGDCIHIFYPQSLAAKAEALELFSVEKQLLSSHTGTLNLQLAQDSLLALKLMQKTCFLRKAAAQQLGLFTCANIPPPAVCKALNAGPFWSVIQILQSALPHLLDSCGETFLIRQGDIMVLDFESDTVQSTVSKIVSSILFLKGETEALMFFNLLQPLLMEFLLLEGFSITLMDFNIPKEDRDEIKRSIEDFFPLLHQLRESFNELINVQIENDLKKVKISTVNFIMRGSSLGNIIDSKSDSTISKVVQQLGLLGLQLSDRGKLYSPALVGDIFSHFMNKYPVEADDCPTKAYGLVGNSFFHGLDPYEALIHSISVREVIIRSSGGLTEPGTLFKNLMSILRDVVLCYDGTIRNVCTNSVILFEYGADEGKSTLSCLPAGEPVGVLAATAISNPAYKAVLDSSQSTNSSWELMKETLLSKINFKNDEPSRRVILYMNDCFCGKLFCKEKAAYAVHSCLKKVTLRDCTIDFSIGYHDRSSETAPGLVGHIHLRRVQFEGLNCKVEDIHKKCLDVIRSHSKKKDNNSQFLRKVTLDCSECCSWSPDRPNYQISQSPCLHFYHGPSDDPGNVDMEGMIDKMVNLVCPLLLDTVIKGHPLVRTTKIVWIGQDTIPRVGISNKTPRGEVAVEVVIEKDIVKQNGDAWKVALDSCLPVMHLIDTRRSIPYGIQQIQDYLGISSAFDQSIQRLSTAIRSVSKGVLKQHLMLVVHCMTISGNVIGFNTAGFKALFRSVEVHVPFTEATLFTPLKCFERAADKCHTDSLSSVVAACSWGKCVAIGTGAHFQIMWNEKQLTELQDVGKDVYSFLQLTCRVRGKSAVHLGENFDDLAEIGNSDENLSPEHSFGIGNFTFDEGPEAHSNYDQTGMRATPAGKVNNWEQGCGDDHCTSEPVASAVERDSWEGWGKEQQHLNIPDKVDGWEKKSEFPQRQNSNAEWTKWGEERQPSNIPDKSDGWEKKSECWQRQNSDAGWTQSGGDQQQRLSTPDKADDWEKKEFRHRQDSDAGSTKWGKDQQRLSIPDNADGWEKKSDFRQSQSSDEGWTKWGEGQKQHLRVPDKSDGWEKKSEIRQRQNSDAEGNKWGEGIPAKAAGWEKKSEFLHYRQNPDAQWNKRGGDHEQLNIPDNADGWGKKSDFRQRQNSDAELTKWSAYKSNTGNLNETEMHNEWGSSQKSKANSPTWGSHSSPNIESTTVASDHTPLSKPDAWVSRGSNEQSTIKSSESGWKPQSLRDGPTKPRGWTSWNSTDNRGKGKLSHDQKGQDAVGHAGGRRQDFFNSEEEKILADVGPIMQSIKRILHLSSYSNGDRLSPGDQTYILDNVFLHHPDRNSKVTGEVDHIMVDRHQSFSDSRCFFVVSTDGSSLDFSYLKCMENFVKKNYPEHGESFSRKYFRRRRGDTGNEGGQQM